MEVVDLGKGEMAMKHRYFLREGLRPGGTKFFNHLSSEGEDVVAPVGHFQDGIEGSAVLGM